jgi:hypothetical protein
MAAQEATASAPNFQLRAERDTPEGRLLLSYIVGRVVARDSGCWEWGTGRDYGRFQIRRSRFIVHRVVYDLCVADVPPGFQVLHECDSPPCCNPCHLFTGTNLDNIADKMKKGRQAHGPISVPHNLTRGEKTNTAKLSAEQVLEIRARHAAGETQTSLGREYGVYQTVISAIVHGMIWAHLPLAEPTHHDCRHCPHCGLLYATRRGAFDRHLGECQAKERP